MKRSRRLFDLGVAIVLIAAGWALYWSRIGEQRAQQQPAQTEATRPER